MAYLKTLVLYPEGDPSSEHVVVLDHPQQLQSLSEDVLRSCPLAVVVLGTGEKYAIRGDHTGYRIEGPLDDRPLAEAIGQQADSEIRTDTLQEAVQNILFTSDLNRFSSVQSISRN